MVATSRGQLRGRANKAVEMQRRGPRREFERLLGRRQVEVEILQAAQDVVRKSMVAQRVREVTGHPDLPDAPPRAADRVLHADRAGLGPLSAGGRRHGPAADPRRDEQPGNLRLSPGMGDGQPPVPGGLQPQVYPPGDADARPDAGAAGACWSGEVVSVVFALDCHDREVPAWLASPRPLTGADVRTPTDRTLWARFGETTVTAPTLSSGCPMTAPQCTATATVLYAHALGLAPITTPAYSPRRATGRARPARGLDRDAGSHDLSGGAIVDGIEA